MLKTQARRMPPPPRQRTSRTTGINLPISTLELLRRVAFERSLRSAGRASVSALIVQLVDRHKKELEKEISKSGVGGTGSNR
jgi:hypothetical protein